MELSKKQLIIARFHELKATRAKANNQEPVSVNSPWINPPAMTYNDLKTGIFPKSEYRTDIPHKPELRTPEAPENISFAELKALNPPKYKASIDDRDWEVFVSSDSSILRSLARSEEDKAKMAVLEDEIFQERQKRVAAFLGRISEEARRLNISKKKQSAIKWLSLIAESNIAFLKRFQELSE